MYNRETVLNKIEVQEKEWDKQIQYLQSKVAGFDSEKRLRMEKYVTHLDLKMKHIQSQTKELKSANDYIWEKYGNKIVETWDELVHNVDYVISSYRNIFNQ